MTRRVRETEGAVADAVRHMYASYPDSIAFDQHLHEQITIWETDKPGRCIGLTELEELRTDRRSRADSEVTVRLWVEDLLVDRWLDEVAVARYVLHAQTADGQTSFRVTDVFDGPKIVHHHAERL